MYYSIVIALLLCSHTFAAQKIKITGKPIHIRQIAPPARQTKSSYPWSIVLCTKQHIQNALDKIQNYTRLPSSIDALIADYACLSELDSLLPAITCIKTFPLRVDEDTYLSIKKINYRPNSLYIKAESDDEQLTIRVDLIADTFAWIKSLKPNSLPTSAGSITFGDPPITLYRSNAQDNLLHIFNERGKIMSVEHAEPVVDQIALTPQAIVIASQAALYCIDLTTKKITSMALDPQLQVLGPIVGIAKLSSDQVMIVHETGSRTRYDLCRQSQTLSHLGLTNHRAIKTVQCDNKNLFILYSNGDIQIIDPLTEACLLATQSSIELDESDEISVWYDPHGSWFAYTTDDHCVIMHIDIQAVIAWESMTLRQKNQILTLINCLKNNHTKEAQELYQACQAFPHIQRNLAQHYPELMENNVCTIL